MKGRAAWRSEDRAPEDIGSPSRRRSPPPEATWAVIPWDGPAPASAPICTQCPVLQRCWRSQVENYHRQAWRFPFARPECEAGARKDAPTEAAP